MAVTNKSAVINVDALATSIFKVVVLPPFWPEHPVLWFSQAEAIFETTGIDRDEAKFGYVVSQLPEKYASEVKHIIIHPPDEDKYLAIKTELIRRRVRALLNKEELGDRTPTEFLARLRSIGGYSHEMLLRTLFFRRLPSQLQHILSGHIDLPLEKMASLADRILDALSKTNNADQNRSPSSSSASSADNGEVELQDLSRRLDSVTRQVSQLTTEVLRNSSLDRSRSRGRHENNICWYHRRWNNRANKCIRPCAWATRNVRSFRRTNLRRV